MKKQDAVKNAKMLALECDRFINVLDKETGFKTPEESRKVAEANFVMMFQHFIQNTEAIRVEVVNGGFPVSDVIEATLQPAIHATYIYFFINGVTLDMSQDLLLNPKFSKAFHRLANLFSELGLTTMKVGPFFKDE